MCAYDYALYLLYFFYVIYEVPTILALAIIVIFFIFTKMYPIQLFFSNERMVRRFQLNQQRFYNISSAKQQQCPNSREVVNFTQTTLLLSAL